MADRVKQLAEALYYNEVSQFTPMGEGLFGHFIKYPHITEEKRHFFHKLWLFRAGKLLEKPELEPKIQFFLKAEDNSSWIETGFELYKISKEEYPEITEAMVRGISCCEEVLDG